MQTRGSSDNIVWQSGRQVMSTTILHTSREVATVNFWGMTLRREGEGGQSLK